MIELSERFHSSHGLDRYLSTHVRMACHSNALLFPEKQEKLAPQHKSSD